MINRIALACNIYGIKFIEVFAFLCQCNFYHLKSVGLKSNYHRFKREFIILNQNEHSVWAPT